MLRRKPIDSHGVSAGLGSSPALSMKFTSLIFPLLFSIPVVIADRPTWGVDLADYSRSTRRVGRNDETVGRRQIRPG